MTGAPEAREEEALALDAEDRVGSARGRFVLPKDDTTSGCESIAYLAGDSLGPPPVDAAADVNHELEVWATIGVEGHWTGGPRGGTPTSGCADPWRGWWARSTTRWSS